MSEITIEWQEAGTLKSQTVSNSATLGRDPTRCNIVLSHPTVSGVHAQIYFRDADSLFYLRNLRGESNPPVVDQRRLVQGEAPLHQGSKIYLGQVAVMVTKTSAHPTQEYGLKCTNLACGRVSAYDRLKLVCPWCGTSLAAAPSVIMPPVKN